MANEAKNFEKRFGEYFPKLVYAGLKDNDLGSEKPSVYSPLSWQNYDNLCKDKKDRAEGIKSRFTLSEPSKQFLTFLFSKMIEELKNIQINDNSNIVDIQNLVREANADCYTDFMLGLVERYRHKFGETLRAAGDPTRWFQNQIIGFLPQYATKPVINGLLSQAFDDFLKSLAWLFSKLLGYYEVSISGELFLGTLAQQAMPQIMLDMLQASLRAKPPTKPRVKKEKTDNTKATGFSDTETTQTTQTTNTQTTNTQTTNTETTNTVVDKDLKDMLENV